MNQPFDLPLFWNRNGPDFEEFQVFLDTDETTPDDFTDNQFVMQIRAYPDAPGDPLAVLMMAAEDEPGFFLPDAPNGWIAITPPQPAALRAIALPFFNGKLLLWHDILRIWPDGRVETFGYGPITLFAGVTAQ